MNNDILKERIYSFIMSLNADYNDELYPLREESIKNDIPIIRDETRDFIALILKLVKPKKILELGTAVGYSTIVMALNTSDCIITTVENDTDRIKKAKENFKKYNCLNKIILIEEDIDEFLKSNENLNAKYDFIFLDAAKSKYVIWLPYLKQMLNINGMLISDNIFKDGEILEHKVTIEKRDRTIHKRMREFLRQISNDKELYTKILNIGDGISISVREKL